MLNRVTSLVLVAAIIACPLWCAAGQVSCCAGETAACEARDANLADANLADANLADANLAAPACCCTAEPSPARSNQAASAFPLVPSSPDQPATPCQGVCGGAVLARGMEKAEDGDADFVPDASPLRHEATWHAVPLILPATTGATLSGRLLRTMHQSLLC